MQSHLYNPHKFHRFRSAAFLTNCCWKLTRNARTAHARGMGGFEHLPSDWFKAGPTMLHSVGNPRRKQSNSTPLVLIALVSFEPTVSPDSSCWKRLRGRSVQRLEGQQSTNQRRVPYRLESCILSFAELVMHRYCNSSPCFPAYRPCLVQELLAGFVGYPRCGSPGPSGQPKTFLGFRSCFFRR